MPIYIRPEDMAAAGASADVICIGDSWFWHPFGNLTPTLNNIFSMQNILLIGESGEEAAGLVDPRKPYLAQFKSALTECAGTVRHVFISAGGNDFAGLDDFTTILNDPCTNAPTPAACYNQTAMRGMFDQISRDIGTLIQEVAARVPNARVRLHNYDYAIPDGRHAIGGGNWLKAPMDKRDVPQPGTLQRGGFRREVVATLVDTFGHWQSELANEYANTTFVRTSGTIADNQWLDELRPSPAGFKKIAKKFAA